MENIRAKNNFENMKQISEDNVMAKAAGMSYGKYKANMKEDYEPSEYEVCKTSYLTPRKKDEDKKAVAMIRFA